MLEIKGYRVIPIPLGVGNAFHYIYIKKHKNNKANDNENNDRTLFVGNIDYFINNQLLSNDVLNDILNKIFINFGTIENITISQFNSFDNQIKSNSPINRSRFAHVLYFSSNSLNSALTYNQTIYNDITSNISKEYGLMNSLIVKSSNEIMSKYLLVNKDVNPKDMKESINQYMNDFDEKQKLLEMDINKKTKEADEDGFILVKPRNKRKLEDIDTNNDNIISDQATNISHKKTTMRSRTKRNQKQLQNFYRYQMKEEKREKLIELRKKFELDKIKINEMKLARKFKPF